MTISASNGQSPTGATTNRADRIKDGSLDHGGSRGENAFQWFDVTAYALPGFIDAAADASDPAVRHCRCGDGDRSQLLHL